MKAKPEVEILFGGVWLVYTFTASGNTEALEGQIPISYSHQTFLDEAGVERLMMESEGITENARAWTTDAISKLQRLYRWVICYKARL
jgi:hypothetical protein